MVPLFLLALGVIVVTGLLVMVETALFSYSITKAKINARRGGRRAKMALAIRERPVRTIASLVVLITATTIGGSLLTGSIAATVFGDRWIGVFSAALIFGSIIFSEVIPKNIGERWNERIIRIAAIPLYWLTLILTPVVWFLELVTKPFMVGKSAFMTSEEEI